MGARIASLARRGAKRCRLDVALALVALGCAATIEALHGHACTGDGCLLCLTATFASMLLFASIGVAFARPLVRMLVELRSLRVRVLPRCESHPSPVASSRAGRVELTPVTMGVRLVI